MKPCVLIPCYNHAATVGQVAGAAVPVLPVLVVDDGSTEPLPALPDCEVLCLRPNRGKAAALRAGFQRARERGYTHAITMDADGQHFVADLPKFLGALAAHPGALLIGVRDLQAAGCPRHRQRSNALSSFWYRVATGVRLRDTQCGFRSYPLALVQQLKIRSNRYAYELEFLVRAAWVGATILPVPVQCTYASGATGRSHFRPVRDFVHITNRNILLVLQAWFVPLSLRAAWSRGERQGFRRAVKEFFTDNAHAPGKMAASVGVGLFFGLTPLWGLHLVLALWTAHRLRLNKAVVVVASNISFPPMVPFLVYGSLHVGAWLLHGRPFAADFAALSGSGWWATAREHLWEWVLGSFALAAGVALMGTIGTYAVAQLLRKR